MGSISCIGELVEKQETLEEKEVHWKIENFRSLASYPTYFDAPAFEFLNARWYLEVKPRNITDRRLSLYLWTDGKESSYNLLCTFGFANVQGVVETRSFYHTFCKRKFEFVATLFDRRKLKWRISELMPSDILTITCKIKNLCDPLQLIDKNTLFKNITDFSANKEFCDTTLYVKDREITAYRFILVARSPVLATMFKHDMLEKQTGIINIPDFDPDLFQEFLTYLYRGTLETISFDSAFHLYKAADKYNVEGLKMASMNYMMQNLKTENIREVIDLAEEHNETDLLAAAKDFLSKNQITIEDVGENFSLLRINS